MDALSKDVAWNQAVLNQEMYASMSDMITAVVSLAQRWVSDTEEPVIARKTRIMPPQVPN